MHQRQRIWASTRRNCPDVPNYDRLAIKIGRTYVQSPAAPVFPGDCLQLDPD